MSIQKLNFYPTGFETFQSELKWWTDQMADITIPQHSTAVSS